MIGIPDPAEDVLGYKACCATLYESDAIRYLLGDSMRPGGLALTREILEAAGVGAGMRVLDVACGGGDSAEAVESLDAAYFGVDLGLKNLTRLNGGRAAAAEAERLPFRDSAFDAVLVQCAFCTFPDKTGAASEMARVLKPGGSLLLADVTLDCYSLPPELDSVFAAAVCLAEAQPLQSYQSHAEAAGLQNVTAQDRPDAASAFLRGIDQKLFMVRMAQAVKAVDLGGLDVAAARRMLKLGLGMVNRGELGYGYVIARKPASTS